MNGSDINVTLVEPRTYHTALQVFKILHNISPIYLQGLFSYTIDATGHVASQTICSSSKDQLWKKTVKVPWNYNLESSFP